MFDSPLVIILTCYSGIGLAGLASCLIGAGLYDLREAKLQYRRQAQPYSKQNRHRPSISIIVYTCSGQQLLINSLQSIRDNLYRNYNIVVVDDTLTSNCIIKHTVRDFTSKYPKTSVKVLQRRKKTTRLEAVTAGLNKNPGTTELIMILDAGSELDKHALHNAANHFNLDNRVTLVLPNTQVISRPSLLGVIEQYNHLLRMSSKKLISLLRVNYTFASSSVLYRQPQGRYKFGQQKQILKYAHDVFVYIEPAASWTQFLTKYYGRKLNTSSRFTKLPDNRANNNGLHTIINRSMRLFITTFLRIMTILTPLVISYLLYLSVNFKQSTLYGLSWIIFSVMLVCLVWGKDHMHWQNRLRLTLLIPPMYSVFYIISFLQMGSATLSILKRKGA